MNSVNGVTNKPTLTGANLETMASNINKGGATEPQKTDNQPKPIIFNDAPNDGPCKCKDCVANEKPRDTNPKRGGATNDNPSTASSKRSNTTITQQNNSPTNTTSSQPTTQQNNSPANTMPYATNKMGAPPHTTTAPVKSQSAMSFAQTNIRDSKALHSTIAPKSTVSTYSMPQTNVSLHTTLSQLSPKHQASLAKILQDPTIMLKLTQMNASDLAKLVHKLQTLPSQADVSHILGALMADESTDVKKQKKQATSPTHHYLESYFEDDNAIKTLLQQRQKYNAKDEDDRRRRKQHSLKTPYY
jgi:hypothetical protein